MEKEAQILDTGNPAIESFLMNAGSLEIHKDFALSEYFNYLEDLRLLSIGIPFSELGIGKRRHSSMPKLIIFDGLSGFQFANQTQIRDEYTTPKGSIALLKLSGVMKVEDSISSSGIESMIRDLRTAYSNRNVEGVIIETNSGGGHTQAGTMLKSAFSERNKPVVGFAHLAASAAYRALSGTDEIIGSGPSSEFGSIGTMVRMERAFLEDYAKKYMDFYGKTSPGKNADFRKAIQGDFSEIEKTVDQMTVSFQNEIRKSRNLTGSDERISETLNGSVYDAADAKRRGMIDMIGNMQTAIRRVKALKSKY